MKNILIDSCVYISYFNENDVHHKESKKFMKWVRDHKANVILFRIVYFEVANVLMKVYGLPFEEVFSQYVGSMLLQAKDNVIELDARFDDNYFYDLYEHGVHLKTLDSLIYLTAYHHDAILISWDKKFVRETKKNWEAFTPKDFLEVHS